MNQSFIIKSFLISFTILVLAGCGGGTEYPECWDFPITPSPNAFVVKVNDQAWPTQNPTDIPIQRSPNTAITILIEYSIQRTWTKCGGSYTGQLSPVLYNLSSGLNANFNPQVIPASQGSSQSLLLTLEVPLTIPDGKITLELRSPEVLPFYNPIYNILLTTKP